MVANTVMPSCLFAAAGGGASSVALISFLIYLVFVFSLALLASRTAAASGFMNEYFLGSRNLGVWAFALTFAATSASGGSFVGFPALIYSKGWVMALWISGYMLVPIVAMGLLGKRLNQLSRRVQAVTIPEVLGERFASPATRVIATLLIVIFIFYYLLAQFKAGSEILASLLSGVPLYEQAVQVTANITSAIPFLAATDPDYVLCLGFFSAAVIFYVVYGGFRAVVWTDVMQGVVMFAGVFVMLILALWYTGGLRNATDKLARYRPPTFGSAELRMAASPEFHVIRKGTWVAIDGEIVRTAERMEVAAGQAVIADVPILIVNTEEERATVPEAEIRRDIAGRITEREAYASGSDEPGVYLRPPGPDRLRPEGYLALGAALSFFAFWPFGGAGQPSNMVRLMAFRDTRTLKLSIMTVAIYYSFIYFSLVVIFCCAKVMIPGMEIEPDRVMPEMAVHSTELAGIPWLAGLLLSAPFAAVMSSVDSFLLLVSSSLVRDIYQRHIHPSAKESTIKRVTYIGTIAVGVLATIAALYPPRYLQDLIVAATSFLASSFLVPMAFALYWKRMTAAGAVAGMLAGCLTHYTLDFALPWLESWPENSAVAGGLAPLVSVLRSINALGLEPFIWDLASSMIAVVVVSLCTRPPSDTLVRRFFDSA